MKIKILCVLISSALFFYAQQPQEQKSTMNVPNEKPRKLADGKVQLGLVTLDPKKKEVSFPGSLNQSERADLELLICTPHGRKHEGLIVSHVSPYQLEFMLYLLGGDNEVKREHKRKKGSLINIDIEWEDDHGTKHRDPIEEWVLDMRSGKTMARRGFYFCGSNFYKGIYQAEGTGNICLLFSSSPATVLDCADPQSGDQILYTTNPDVGKAHMSRNIRIIMSLRKER